MDSSPTPLIRENKIYSIRKEVVKREEIKNAERKRMRERGGAGKSPLNVGVVFKGSPETSSRGCHLAVGQAKFPFTCVLEPRSFRERENRGLGILIWGMNLTRCWRCWHYACRPFCHVVAKVYFLIRAPAAILGAKVSTPSATGAIGVDGVLRFDPFSAK